MRNTDNSSLPLFTDLTWVTSSRVVVVFAKCDGPDQLGDVQEVLILRRPWMAESSGKRGGIRVIYYWQVSEHQIFMLLAYPKNQQDNLTSSQLKILRKLVEQEFGNG